MDDIAKLIIIALGLSGIAVYYGPGWDWDRIAQNQGTEIPSGYTPIAYWDCSKIGETGWGFIEGDPEPWEFIIVDCTAERDVETVRGRGIIMEIPCEEAEQRPGMIENGNAAAWLKFGGMPLVFSIGD